VSTEDWTLRLPPELQANVMIGLGFAISLSSGPHDLAAEQLGRARTLCLKEGLPLQAAISLQYIGHLHRTQGEYAKAVKELKSAEQELAAINNHEMAEGQLLRCRVDIATLMTAAGRGEEAVPYLLQLRERLTAGPMESSLEKRGLQIKVLKDLADAYYVPGPLQDLKLAISYAKESLAAARATGRKDGQAYALWTLGNIMELKAEYNHSITLLGEAAILFENIALPALAATIFRKIGLIYRHKKDTGRCREAYTKAIKLWEGYGDPFRTAECVKGMAAALYKFDDPGCIQYYEKARTIFIDVNKMKEAASCLSDGALASLKFKQANPQEALDMLHKARIESFEAGDLLEAFLGMGCEGDLYLVLNNRSAALWSFQTAALCLREMKGSEEDAARFQRDADELISNNPGLELELAALDPVDRRADAFAHDAA